MPQINKFYSDDTFLVSYPRSGNTWMRYLIANIKSPNNTWNLQNISEVVPDMYETNIDHYLRPRIIKSHELYREEYPRVIYMYRDGRDVSISYYHLYQTANGFMGSFPEFLYEMLSGNLGFGSWHEHIKSWLFGHHTMPLQEVKYELLCEKTVEVMKTITNFLGLDIEEELIVNAVNRSSFEKQKKDVKEFSPHFAKGFRGGIKGGPGKWKEVFDDGLLKLFWSHAGETMERLGYSMYE